LKNIRLRRADDKLVDIPAQSITTLIGLSGKPPESFPDAKAIVFYDFGLGTHTDLVVQSTQEIFGLIGLAPNFLPLHGPADTHYLRQESIVRMLEVDPEQNNGCHTQVHFRPGLQDDPKFEFVTETMAEIDKLRDSASVGEVLPPLPAPPALTPKPRTNRRNS